MQKGMGLVLLFRRKRLQCNMVKYNRQFFYYSDRALLCFYIPAITLVEFSSLEICLSMQLSYCWAVRTRHSNMLYQINLFVLTFKVVDR
jgi:hypothetical protein